MIDLLIREANDGDTAFIYATWLKHYKSNSYFAKRIPHYVYYPEHQRIIERILNDPATQVSIAYPVEEPEVIFGFMVSTRKPAKDLLHFVFVKRELRRMGIGRKLFEASGITGEVEFTHWTFELNDFMHLYPQFKYNPYEV